MCRHPRNSTRVDAQRISDSSDRNLVDYDDDKDDQMVEVVPIKNLQSADTERASSPSSQLRWTRSIWREEKQGFDFQFIPPYESFMAKQTYVNRNREYDKQPESTRGCSDSVKEDSECWQENPHFGDALMLLRADVITLCIKAGVKVQNMWPSEFLLLNLEVLHQYCMNRAIESKDWYEYSQHYLDAGCDRILVGNNFVDLKSLDENISKRYGSRISIATLSRTSNLTGVQPIGISSSNLDTVNVDVASDWCWVDDD